MARINLVPNPSFRQGTTGYSGAGGASIAVSTTQGFYGTTSLQVTKAASNNSGVQTAPIPVTAGLPYSFSGYVFVPITVPPSETSSLIMTITWLNYLGTVLSSTASAILAVSPSTTWERLTGVTTAPGGAVAATISVTQLVAGTAGQAFYLDALLFEQSSFVGGYLDNVSQTEETAIVNKSLSVYNGPTIGGLPLEADISLGDFVFNTIDENNVVWVCTDLDGWYGQADPQTIDIPRGVEDGSYDVSGRTTARIITLSGSFLVPDPSYVGAARDALVSATNLVRDGAWLRTNEAPTRAAFVRLSGKVQIETTNARGRTDFSIGLKAADPIRYEWNDADPDGLTDVTVAPDSTGFVDNIGTTEVTGVFTLTGPLGSGSTVTNITRDETITMAQDLRGAGSVGQVVAKELTDNVVTITTGAEHNLVVGDEVIVSGCGFPFDAVNETLTVTAVTDLLPYTFNYVRIWPDIAQTASAGSVLLASNDSLSLDTYERTVTFNGNILGNRSRVNTLIDWIKFSPGENLMQFVDTPAQQQIDAKALTSNVVTITTDQAHFFSPGDTIYINLPTTASIAIKSLTSNVVTLTTAQDHGFSVGDKITVNSTSVSNITNKVLTSNVATLTTDVLGAFSTGDSITISMSTTKNIITKGVASNIVTIGTDTSHGYSIGDSVLIAFSSLASIATKSITSNKATITTTSPHGFTLGDTLTVALPTSTSVISKYVSGGSVILTTAASHAFSVGDTISIALPSSATLTSTRSAAGAGTYLITQNTTAAHGFAVGDQITTNTGLSTTYTPTIRSATTSTATLTIGTHSVALNELVSVTGSGNSQYNGTFFVTAITSTTITLGGTFTAESATAESSSARVLNLTVGNGYNGTHRIETVPSSTSFTYLFYPQAVSTSNTTAGTINTVVNVSNTTINGSKVITSIPSANQMSYNI